MILENESAMEPEKQDFSKKDLIAKMNDRLHKGGKHDNVLGAINSMRVRTNKSESGDWLIKHEISTNAWASGIIIPFNCSKMINIKLPETSKSKVGKISDDLSQNSESISKSSKSKNSTSKK